MLYLLEENFAKQMKYVLSKGLLLPIVTKLKQGFT